MSEAFLLDKRSLGYAEDYVPAPDHVRAAREDAVSAGVPAPSNGVTTALTFLAKVLDAKAVVEIGTGTGATGLALFEGMSPQGVLTSIDPEVGWQLTAKQAFRDRQIASQHFRLIAGRPLEVVNNLRDAAYDLVLVNAEKLEYVEHVAQAERLLRPGGVSRSEIEAVVGPLAAPASGKIEAPGMLASHYAPRARLRLDATELREGEAGLDFGGRFASATGAEVLDLSRKADLVEAASRLYFCLRALDATGAAAIAVAPVPTENIGEAIRDRLARAAAPRDGGAS